MDVGPNQLSRARTMTVLLNELYPHLASAKEGLQKILSEPPDGSIDETTRKQMESVRESASELLLSLLFVK